MNAQVTYTTQSTKLSSSGFRRLCLSFSVFALTLLTGIPYVAATQPDHVIMIVLEGVGKEGILSGSMPVVANLAKEGAVSWSAESLSPPLTVPAMASLLTGLPISKHRVTSAWEEYDFARSFLRSPTVFDYMDLAGGRDSAVFFMDERFYQLSRPEIYVDSQTCGIAKPQCNPDTIAIYVRDYLKKVTSEKGYGFRLIEVPNLLLVHMPTALRSGKKYGWNSEQYKQSLSEIDSAIGKIRDNYRELDVLDKTMFLITSLNAAGPTDTGKNGNSAISQQSAEALSPKVPWIASGNNVKKGITISRKISLQDTGATILYALGLKTHTEWESQAIDEIFKTVPEHRTTENEMPASLY
ncbi:MAG: alkaline phosphatase family protein [Nitrospirales bacterium]|nr:alkaline phosphatase family protein [Nitrospira sp.]MDR4500723.1 alkaline phosphatase family protein [Nitrospirales bacterium]